MQGPGERGGGGAGGQGAVGAASPSPSCSVPVAMVTLTALLTYGSTRFRFAAEPSIVVLAAVAVDALVGRGRNAA